MDRLQSMRTFAKVVDEGSFTGAARRLDLGQAVVTRLVADLEAHLDTRLLNRTTRSLRLTDAGERYLQHCRQILADVDAAEETVREANAKISGRVRLAVPQYFALELIAPRGLRFHRLYPDIVLDVTLLDRPVDIVSEGFDLAVVPSSFSVPNSVIARSLLKQSIKLFASPAYAAAAQLPPNPQQLADHMCIGNSNFPLRDQWRLIDAQGDVAHVPLQTALQSNSQAFVRQAVRAGLGIGPLIQYDLQPSPSNDDLIAVLPQWSIGNFDLNIVYPSREHLPRRVRAVIDFFVQESAALTAELA